MKGSTLCMDDPAAVGTTLCSCPCVCGVGRVGASVTTVDSTGLNDVGENQSVVITAAQNTVIVVVLNDEPVIDDDEEEEVVTMIEDA